MPEYDGLRMTDLRARVAQEVSELVAMHQEWTYWDFKREWHHDRFELLRDIICLANNLDWHTAYLIIGIDEENGYIACDVREDPNRRSTENLTDWLGKVPWAGSRRPQVVVVPLDLDGATVDVVTIFQNRDDVPYYLEKGQGKLRANAIYTRRNNTNTPVDGSATRDEVERLWSHRFGLDQAPIDRLPSLLRDRENWVPESQVYDTQKRYYKFSPESTIEQEWEEDRDSPEYYILNQCDPTPHFKRAEIKYYGTQIYDDLLVVLDGGRYSSPVPEWSFMFWWGSRGIDADVSYCYFNEDSLGWRLHLFLYDEGSSEARTARRRLLDMVLVFPDENCRQGFEHFVQENRSEFEERFADAEKPYVPDLPDNYVPEHFEKQIKQAQVLREMLDEYRKGKHPEYAPIRTTTDW